MKWTWFVPAAILAACVLETRRQPPKILFVGNSITMSIKRPDIGWNLDAGMAASHPSRDYVNQTIGILKERGMELEPVLHSRDCEIRDGVINEHMENIDDVREMRPRYVVVQLGENSDETQVRSGRLLREYVALLSALKERGARDIFCFTNWDEDTLADLRNDAVVKAVRHFPSGIHLVDITSLAGDPANYGDTALYQDPAVRWHPGDLGMERMARALADAVWERR